MMIKYFPPLAKNRPYHQHPKHAALVSPICCQGAHQVPALQDAEQGTSGQRDKANGHCTPCAPSPAGTRQPRLSSHPSSQHHIPLGATRGWGGRRPSALLSWRLCWDGAFACWVRWWVGFPTPPAKVVFAKAAFISPAFKSRSYQGINHPVTCREACEGR